MNGLMSTMKSIEEIRRSNLLLLIADRCEGNQSEAARRLGYPKPTQVNHWTAGRKNIKTESARKIEAAFGMRDFWMDVEHKSAITELSKNGHKTVMFPEPAHRPGSRLDPTNVGPGPETKGKLPVISWVQAGTWEEDVDNFSVDDAEEWIAPPIATSGNAFWLRVRGESMFNPDGEPSFRENDLILVEPHERAESGSLAIIKLPDDPEVIFRQLILEGGKKYVKALNPGWPNRIVEIDGNAAVCGVVKSKFVRY